MCTSPRAATMEVNYHCTTLCCWLILELGILGVWIYFILHVSCAHSSCISQENWAAKWKSQEGLDPQEADPVPLSLSLGPTTWIQRDQCWIWQCDCTQFLLGQFASPHLKCIFFIKLKLKKKSAKYGEKLIARFEKVLLSLTHTTTQS